MIEKVDREGQDGPFYQRIIQVDQGITQLYQGIIKRSE